MNIQAASEPIFDVAHLAHVELLTPDLESSSGFFQNLLGMQVTERKGGSVFLRGYEEHYHHSLKLTQARHAGLGHVGWRARSPQALERRVTAINASGHGVGWVEAGPGQGRTYRFQTPEGHAMELFWEVDYASPPQGKETALLNRPQRRPSARHSGAPHRPSQPDDRQYGTVRDFFADVLGFRERERVEVDGGGPLIGSWLVSPTSP